MKNYISILLVLLCLSACGLSPQIVKIDPELSDAKSAPASSGSTFKLVVTDARNSDTLGKRGGIYKDTSVIMTEGDITAGIQQKLSDAFTKAGYKVDPSATKLLEVSITKLGYQGYGENRIKEVEVSAEIIATATNSKTKFTKSYKANRKKEVLKAPDEKKNSELINEIFSGVIQRVVDDDEFLSYIK